MTTLKVTELEKKVLEALANEMYAELGFSDAGLDEVEKATGLPASIIRGVQSSLSQKGLIELYDRKGEMGINHKDPRMHIWYLTEKTNGLVKHWVDENDIEPVTLEVQ